MLNTDLIDFFGNISGFCILAFLPIININFPAIYSIDILVNNFTVVIYNKTVVSTLLNHRRISVSAA